MDPVTVSLLIREGSELLGLAIAKYRAAKRGDLADSLEAILMRADKNAAAIIANARRALGQTADTGDPAER